MPDKQGAWTELQRRGWQPEAQGLPPVDLSTTELSSGRREWLVHEVCSIYCLALSRKSWLASAQRGSLAMIRMPWLEGGLAGGPDARENHPQGSRLLDRHDVPGTVLSTPRGNGPQEAP